MSRETRGPDLVLAGAARSGTTTLAAWLGRHQGIVSPSIKEPNYFSTRHERGADWYVSLFGKNDGLWIDASAQYSYPSHLDALRRIDELNPDARVIYLVRDPLPRAFSHYCHETLYMGHHDGADFGSAMNMSPDILGASDYPRIIKAISDVTGPERLLVLPFELVTGEPERAAKAVWSFAGLDPEAELSAIDPALFANERGVIANPLARRAFKAVRTTRVYPYLRRMLGADRMRRARSRLTTSDPIPSWEESLATCSTEQHEQMASLADSSAQAVRSVLAKQDQPSGEQFLGYARWLDAPTRPR